MVSTTLPTSCFTLVSRPLPSLERRKYLDTTTFVANIDQAEGTSTSGCSNMMSPFSLVMTDFLFSHLICSNVCSAGLVNIRFKYSCLCSLILLGVNGSALSGVNV